MTGIYPAHLANRKVKLFCVSELERQEIHARIRHW
jgi:hypothetical protein